MATTTKKRRHAVRPASGRNGSKVRGAADFVPGSLETELSAIGRSVPLADWKMVPADYFANLDHFLHGAPKKK